MATTSVEVWSHWDDPLLLQPATQLSSACQL